jgi:predicted nuclease of predicted toxin-antitoxin system
MMAEWLTEFGHQPIHASRAGLHNAADSAILAVASAEQRVVVTADLDYPRLLALSGAAGPGLILLRGGNISDAASIEFVRRVLFAIPHAELPQSLVVVDGERVRRRWLPV